MIDGQETAPDAGLGSDPRLLPPCHLFGGHRDVETNLEVQITDSVSVEAVYENDSDFGLGNIGGDLRWRLEF